MTTSDDEPACRSGKCDGPHGRFDVNDVSILFPLPANDAARSQALWLKPRAGEQGPYFPWEHVDTLPGLNADVPDSLGYPAAMITSVRFDPCFPRLGGESCQPQLRLVAQPVLTSASGVTMLDDAAAHLFYKLPASEAAEVIAMLAMIRDASPASTRGPLGVHPALATEPHGSAATAIRQLVVDHCRYNNLIRVTTNSFAFDNWGFAKFDRVDDFLERQELVGMAMPESSQSWRRQAAVDDLNDPTGTIDPAPASGFTYFLSAANFSNAQPRDPAAARTAALRLTEIENPELTDAETTDCVSCHLATQARLFAARNGVSFDNDKRFVAPTGVDASLVLAPPLRGNLGNTIAFGYHTQSHGDGGSYPSISQRTVNESAAIAAFLSRAN